MDCGWKNSLELRGWAKGAMSEERTGCNRSEGNEVRAVCEYDRGRGLEGDEGTGRTRGACTEALAVPV